MIILGDQLERLCSEGKGEILLVAPFIKTAVLNRLLLKISDNVKICCITRWRPEEILCGVSDLEVWHLIKERKNAILLLRPDLHAKYYRIDNQCLIGSANLTATALGWSNNPNLELLISSEKNNPQLESFEKVMLDGCVQVDESIFKELANVVLLMRENHFVPPLTIEDTGLGLEEFSNETTIPAESWIPTLRNPEDLYLAYCGRGQDLSTIAQKNASADLLMLRVIPALSKDAFKSYVGSLLLQKSIIRRVDSFLATPQRFGAVSALLCSLPCANISGFNADIAWQTLMRWLIYFLPHRYKRSVPRHSEIFSRISPETR